MSASKELEKDIKQNEETIKTMEALYRLEKNRDFKKIFTNYLLKEKVISLVMELAEREKQSVEEQQSIKDSLKAISHVSLLMDEIANAGEMAIRNINNNREELKMAILEEERENE